MKLWRVSGVYPDRDILYPQSMLMMYILGAFSRIEFPNRAVREVTSNKEPVWLSLDRYALIPKDTPDESL